MRPRRPTEAPAAPRDEPSPHGSGSSSHSPGSVQRRAWTWAVSGVAGVGLVFAIYALAVLTEAGQQTENLALLGSDFRSEAERERSLERLAPLTAGTFAVALAAAVLLGYLRMRFLLGLAAMTLMILSVVLAEVLKAVLPRPPLVEGPGWLLRNSFPSGTAAVAAAVAVALILLVPDRLRWLGTLAACALVGVVAHALQVSGWHRLSDVLASTLLVVAVGALVMWALVAGGWGCLTPHRVVHPVVYRAVAALAAGAVGVGLLLLLLLAVFPTLSAPVGSRRAFLQVSFPLLGAGASVLAVAAFAWIANSWSLGREPDEGDRRARRDSVSTASHQPGVTPRPAPHPGRVAVPRPPAPRNGSRGSP